MIEGHRIRCLLSLLLCWVPVGFSWPDGAPCISRILESMTPEAEQHAGGQQYGPAPFRIFAEAPCYNIGQPIEIVLEAMTDVSFKGFAIQPKKQSTNERTGEFTRDDNGSWKYQCFGKKASITHSHATPKTRLEVMWMETVNHGQSVTFTATVVQNLKRFWVQSIKTEAIPHCRSGQRIDVPKADERFRQRSFESRGPFSFGRHGQHLVGNSFGSSSNDFTRSNRRTEILDTDSQRFIQRTTTERPLPELPSWCHDVDPQCPDWKSMCGYDNYVIKNCERTCRVCSRQNHDISNSFQNNNDIVERVGSLERQGSSSGCEDKDSGCYQWKTNCGFDSWVQDNCKNTCGQCGGGRGKSPSSSNCADKDGSCDGWKGLCGSDTYVDSHCPLTCGTCGGREFNRVDLANIIDPTPTHQRTNDHRATGDCRDKDNSCSEWYNMCGRDDYVIRNCRHTCGSCGSPSKSNSNRSFKNNFSQKINTIDKRSIATDEGEDRSAAFQIIDDQTQKQLTVSPESLPRFITLMDATDSGDPQNGHRQHFMTTLKPPNGIFSGKQSVDDSLPTESAIPALPTFESAGNGNERDDFERPATRVHFKEKRITQGPSPSNQASNTKSRSTPHPRRRHSITPDGSQAIVPITVPSVLSPSPPGPTNLLRLSARPQSKNASSNTALARINDGRPPFSPFDKETYERKATTAEYRRLTITFTNPPVPTTTGIPLITLRRRVTKSRSFFFNVANFKTRAPSSAGSTRPKIKPTPVRPPPQKRPEPSLTQSIDPIPQSPTNTVIALSERNIRVSPSFEITPDIIPGVFSPKFSRESTSIVEPSIVPPPPSIVAPPKSRVFVGDPATFPRDEELFGPPPPIPDPSDLIEREELHRQNTSNVSSKGVRLVPIHLLPPPPQPSPGNLPPPPPPFSSSLFPLGVSERPPPSIERQIHINNNNEKQIDNNRQQGFRNTSLISADEMTAGVITDGFIDITTPLPFRRFIEESSQRNQRGQGSASAAIGGDGLERTTQSVISALKTLPPLLENPLLLCSDKDPNCEGRKPLCPFKHIKVKCAATCGQCSRPISGPQSQKSSSLLPPAAGNPNSLSGAGRRSSSRQIKGSDEEEEDDQCRDYSETCHEWADLCPRRDSYLTANCPKTCGYCRSDEDGDNELSSPPSTSVTATTLKPSDVKLYQSLHGPRKSVTKTDEAMMKKLISKLKPKLRLIEIEGRQKSTKKTDEASRRTTPRVPVTIGHKSAFKIPFKFASKKPSSIEKLYYLKKLKAIKTVVGIKRRKKTDDKKTYRPVSFLSSVMHPSSLQFSKRTKPSLTRTTEIPQKSILRLSKLPKKHRSSKGEKNKSSDLSVAILKMMKPRRKKVKTNLLLRRPKALKRSHKLRSSFSLKPKLKQNRYVRKFMPIKKFINDFRLSLDHQQKWKSFDHNNLHQDFKKSLNSLTYSQLLTNKMRQKSRRIQPTPPPRTFSGPCEDIDQNCVSWLSTCDTDSWMKENCRFSCGQCNDNSWQSNQYTTTRAPSWRTGGSAWRGGNQWSAVPAPASNSWPSPAPSPSWSSSSSSASCTDRDSSCPTWSKQCHESYVRLNCKHTCNLCHGSSSSSHSSSSGHSSSFSSSSSSSSSDIDPNCKGWRLFCHRQDIINRCPQTCASG